MKETGIEKVALAVTVACSLIASGTVLVGVGWLLILFSSLVVVQPAFAQSATAGVRLETGIAKEEVDGDLKSAMDVYQGIAADSSAPRDVRAKALLRLAGCYEKLGRQAKQLYEQVVRDYADQPAASQARTRLTVLRQQEHPAAPTTMTVRKIEQSGLGSMGSSDTDGQRAVYADSSGNLFFGDLAGHSKRIIFKAQPGDPPGWIPSRDFSMVDLHFSQRPRRLAVVKTDGTGYRELVRDDAQGSILGDGFHAGWSWDNRSLLIWSNLSKGGGHLFVVNVPDGRRRDLLKIEAGRFNKAVFSPDGRFVAYELAPQPDDEGETSRVFVFPVEGSQPRLVYESAPSHKFPSLEHWTLRDWTTDGRYLIIADARSGKAALYMLPVKNGVSTGAPVFVRFGECEDGFITKAGAFVYSTRSGGTEIYLGSLDAGGALGGWRRLAIRNFGLYTNPLPSFSPDGRHVAYVAADEDPAFARDLVLQDLSDGEERVLYRSRNARLWCQYAIQHAKVFCTEVREREGKEEEKTDLLAISAESGQIERLASFVSERRWIMILQPSHDDQAVYLEKNPPRTEDGVVVRRDVGTGREAVVATNGQIEQPSLDDRWASDKGLAVRPMFGGEWRLLCSTRELPGGPMTTAPDGNWVYYLDRDSAGKPSLFRVAIAGGQPEEVGDLPTDLRIGDGSLHFSHDGRQILAVSNGLSKQRDLWILNNFVPPGKQ